MSNSELNWYGYVLLLLLGQACQSGQMSVEDQHFLQRDSVQLAPPFIARPSVFFEKSTLLPLKLDVDGVRLSYELKVGDAVKQGDYQAPLDIHNDFQLKVQAHHPDFQSSETSSVEGLRIDNCINYQIQSASPEPDERYAGRGWNNLHDKVKGNSNHWQKEWLGFNGQEVQIDLELEKAVATFSCTISCLVKQGSWIFAPETIEILASKDGENFMAPLQVQTEKAAAETIAYYFPKLSGTLEDCRFLRIKIKALTEIPEWHLGAGNPAWVFIDEILIKE